MAYGEVAGFSDDVLNQYARSCVSDDDTEHVIVARQHPFPLVTRDQRLILAAGGIDQSLQTLHSSITSSPSPSTQFSPEGASVGQRGL
jgi:hypothetical protein